MKKRWYDHDPMLSMAVSLLQNASKSDQTKTVQYVLGLLEEEQLLQGHYPPGKNPLKLSHIFPFKKRRNFEESSWRLLEILKHLPTDTQMDMALNMINYIYLLEAGITITEDEATPMLQKNQAI